MFITKPFSYAFRKINPKKEFEVILITPKGKTNKGKFTEDKLENVVDRLLSSVDNEVLVRNLETKKEITLNWEDRMKIELDKVI